MSLYNWKAWFYIISQITLIANDANAYDVDDVLQPVGKYIILGKK